MAQTVWYKQLYLNHNSQSSSGFGLSIFFFTSTVKQDKLHLMVIYPVDCLVKNLVSFLIINIIYQIKRIIYFHSTEKQIRKHSMFVFTEHLWRDERH